jgi:hypothetical protein
MACSPRFKVFNAGGDYRAAFKDLSEAAAFVAILGAGAEIRAGHARRTVLWREGSEQHPASESYDNVACVALLRLTELYRQTRAYAYRPPTEQR